MKNKAFKIKVRGGNMRCSSCLCKFENYKATECPDCGKKFRELDTHGCFLEKRY